MSTHSAIGGGFDCYPPGWPPCSPPQTFVIGTPSRSPAPSIAEQLGTDPISKLAAAMHDLADAIRSIGDGGSGI